MNFPTLYKRTSTGKIQSWFIRVDPLVANVHGNGETVGQITTVHGQVNGKKQTDFETIREGKNLGKVNETTPFEQACADAKSKWERKKKKGYVGDIEVAKQGGIDDSVILGGISPMLAHKFSDQGHKINYPCFVQPKLDGHRCIAIVKDGVCSLWSRQRKEILGVPHIARAIEALNLGDVILDGELYTHETPFESLASFIRQTTPKPGHEAIQYWVYDCCLDHKDFADRLEFIESIYERLIEPSPIVVVPTFQAQSEDDLMTEFEGFLNEGYEGMMARNVDSLYINKRSYDLQKIKEFDDAEFEIVDVIEGKGRLAGHGIFICKTENGDEFKAKMKGDLDNLRDFWQNPQNYRGKWLTVQYQGITGKNGVPRFPVAQRIREEL